MGVDDALGIGGGAGGEDDLEGRVEGDGGGNGEVGLRGEVGAEVVEGELREGCGEGGEMGGVGEDELGGDVGDDARGELGRAGGVEWNGEDAAQQAAEEGGDPLGGVVSPEDDTLAGGDTATVEFGGKSSGESGEFGVGGRVAAYAAIADDRRLPTVAAEIFDEAG
jgi:hypothetical protein